MSSTSKKALKSDISELPEKKTKIDIKDKSQSSDNVKETKLKRYNNQFDIRPDILNDMLPSNVGFHITNGIRFLDSYWSVFGSYAKGRWVGRKVSEVFSTEFLSHNKYYPKAAIRLGRLFINGKQMTNPNYRFRTSDRVIHLGHRHEHPILAEPHIDILADTDKWFVVNKPPSMPVHACGQYRVHSVVGLLRTMHNITGLKICHRLDRTTSGVLIFARDYETDVKFKEMLRNKELSKEYICKVEGIFPDFDIVCSVPISVLSISMGIQCVKDDGKKALSRFCCISKNESENTSLVLCQIDTGRTHQIRVHLQYLGYPIVNDYLYNDDVWGPEKGKSANYGKSIEELKTLVQERHKSSLWFEEESTNYENHLRTIAENTTQLPDNIDLHNLQLENLPKYDSICLGCNVAKRIPSQGHFQIMLHCWRYKSADWHFEAPLPTWAKLSEDKLISTFYN